MLSASETSPREAQQSRVFGFALSALLGAGLGFLPSPSAALRAGKLTICAAESVPPYEGADGGNASAEPAEVSLHKGGCYACRRHGGPSN